MAKLYFLNEVAEILRTSEYGVRDLIKDGKLDAMRVGGKIRVSSYAIDAMLGGGSQVITGIAFPMDDEGCDCACKCSECAGECEDKAGEGFKPEVTEPAAD